MRYKITSTGVILARHELSAAFPGVSFAPALEPAILAHFGLEALPDAPTKDPTPQELADALAAAKVAKNEDINNWRAQANNTSFTHGGKQVACDALSRSDIDAVAGSISLSGVFPAGFPGAWKAMDNSYIMLPDVAAFKALYASMTAQGSINFGKSQALKTQLAACTSLEQVDALVWS